MPLSFNPLDRIVFIKRVALFAAKEFKHVALLSQISSSFHETMTSNQDQQYGTTKTALNNIVESQPEYNNIKTIYDEHSKKLLFFLTSLTQHFDLWLVKFFFLSIIHDDPSRQSLFCDRSKLNPLVSAIQMGQKQEKVVEFFVDYIEEKDIDDSMQETAEEVVKQTCIHLYNADLAKRIFRICAKAQPRSIRGTAFQS